MNLFRKATYLIIAAFTATLYSFVQQKGKATFYSKRANGARTASGIRLNNDSLVCAHRTHPFGTLLLVRNPANGKEVIVKVIDRGPFSKSRIIDLSWEAANRLGIIRKGVAAVEVSVWHEKKGVPYAAEPDEIPELELEVNEPAEGMTPVWQKRPTPTRKGEGEQ